MPFSGYEDLDPQFADALQALVAANPGITPFSGYRSIERQRQLWEASDKTGRMVARPGRSQHNFGRAVDLHYANEAAKRFAHENAQKFGLVFPMSWEDWHVEPIGARGGPHASAPRDLAADTPQTEAIPGVPFTGMPTADSYQRPLPFSEGYGFGDLLQAGIGGTLRNDLRAGLFSRLGKLFGI